jgi:Family of unknown function (DUF5906)
MSDEFDDHPTTEEIKASKKRVIGEDNVVQFPDKKDNDKEDSKDSILKRLDKYFATVIKEDKYKVINETISGKIIFMAKKDFVDLMAPEKMLITTTSPNNNVTAKFEPVSKLWLEGKHRCYGTVVFDPRNVFDPSVWGQNVNYNLFRGFGVKPNRGRCYKTLQYIKNVLCCGNKEHYRWLMAWCAQMFQRPWEKPETAVAIQGEEEGTGKSFFPQILSKLLDGKDYSSAHKLYFTTSNAKMITGDFSGHLEHCILLHAEEAFRAESDREDSIIKNLISEDNLSINAKNIEAKLSRNFIRLILTGNPPHIVKAGRFARRFLVLKISNKNRLNTEFFKKLTYELDNGGYEALMYYLMHYPINKFNLRIVLKTEGLLEQQIESMKGEIRFWYIILHTGELPYIGTSIGKYYGGAQTEYHVIKYKLINHFQRFMNKKAEKNRSDEVSFGMTFSKFFPIINERGEEIKDRDGKPMKYLKTDKIQETNHYIIPPLIVCRRLFDVFYGQKFVWPDNDEWVEKQYGDV